MYAHSKEYAHRVVAEAALGRPLPPRAVVHHVDGDKRNNSPSNLVICNDQKYHLILHARQRIVELGGNPNTDKMCSACRVLKAKEEFARHKSKWDGRANECKDCANVRRRQ